MSDTRKLTREQIERLERDYMALNKPINDAYVAGNQKLVNELTEKQQKLPWGRLADKYLMQNAWLVVTPFKAWVINTFGNPDEYED